MLAKIMLDLRIILRMGVCRNGDYHDFRRRVGFSPPADRDGGLKPTLPLYLNP